MPRKKKKQLVLHREWCKGCAICVEFCPTHVLALDADGKVTIADEAACTECRLCELRCPDFAIALEPLPDEAGAGEEAR
jgi:2-oxoglutarate ferredoxin oxidoreductase subunit delta